MYTLIIDIETTGVDSLKDTPIQLAWIALNGGHKEVGKGSFFILPNAKLSEKVVKITGITNKELQLKGYSNTAGAKKYMDLVWNYQPCTLVGHNLIAFDFPFLHNWMERFYNGTFKQPPIARLEDTMHLAGIHFKTRKWLKLEECGNRLEILFNKEQLHDARADVELTKAVYLSLLD